MHRALRRPGRCLAHIHIGSLSSHEANALLPTNRRADRDLTLAEVLEWRGELTVLGDVEERVATGAYL